MSGEIKIKDGIKATEWVRPTWLYNRVDGRSTGLDLCQLEMLESIRNTIEELRGAQTLQCDVAHAIKDMARTLRRIDRRLAKVEKLK